MNWLLNLFKSKDNSLTVQRISLSNMDFIKDAIYSHLEMQTNGALLLTGDWGSGKTYHIKNKVIPKIEEDGKFIPLIVSLYGEVDKSNIAQRVLFAFLDRKGKDVKLSTGKIAQSAKAISEAFPILKKYVDLDKMLMGTGENVFNFLPHENLIIFFDDLERMSEKIKPNDFLGLVNELVENRKCKVVLIANEEEIKGGISYKEKTIEKTVHYLPNLGDVFDNIIFGYEDEKFKKFLIENKDFILSTLNPALDNKTDERELKKSFSNIRTLKFSLEHFRVPFNLVEVEKDIEEEITKKQLRNLWIFTLSISAEFRKPNRISFTELKGLDKYTAAMFSLDSPFSDFNNLNVNKHKDNDGEKEVRVDISQWFVDVYYKRLSEQYIFYPELYKFITSGQKIDKDEFFKHLEASFNIEDGVQSPAYELLNRFMYKGYYSFSNEEFSRSLNDLLKFVEDGELGDIISYLNSGVFLLGFNEYFNKSKEDIKAKIKIGIEKALKRIKVNYLLTSQLEMSEDSFKQADMQEIYDYAKEKVKERESENNKEIAKHLENLFLNDLEAFVQELMSNTDSSIRTPDKPVFQNFDLERSKMAIRTWTPNAIMNLNSFLKYRYIDSSFSDRLTEEVPFLEALYNGIGEMNLEEKKLSNNIIQRQLKPNLEKCIAKLKPVKPKKEDTVLYNIDE